MRSANPALNNKTFDGFENYADKMTLNGTVNNTAILLALVLISAMWVWGQSFETGDLSFIFISMLIGCFGGLFFGLFTIFFQKYAPYTAPIYALLEGLSIGGISAYYEIIFPGIVIQAVSLTFGTLFCLLAAYKSGLIKATENFKLGVVAATGAICLIYIADLVLRFSGMSIGFIHESGFFGILFSLFVVTIAALNFVLDFDFIESGVESGSPKYMEWYGAFGLILTLVWLYLEILHLLAKLRQ